jgi:hypothetical protein
MSKAIVGPIPHSYLNVLPADFYNPVLFEEIEYIWVK